MNKLESERTLTEIELSAALDQSVEAAVALRIPESELVARLLQRIQDKTPSNVVPLRSQPKTKLFDPLAGP